MHDWCHIRVYNLEIAVCITFINVNHVDKILETPSNKIRLKNTKNTSDTKINFKSYHTVESTHKQLKLFTQQQLVLFRPVFTLLFIISPIHTALCKRELCATTPLCLWKLQRQRRGTVSFCLWSATGVSNTDAAEVRLHLCEWKRWQCLTEVCRSDGVQSDN